MKLISEQDWLPSGVDDLEPNAWEALRAPGSVCVVAGPGAGKTEFLAQRATYLLQTGLCAYPRRILAISFKTDAAANLAERVRARCPPEMGNRFVSQTFDSFTKGLVDRFNRALPTHWRPTVPYEIGFPTRQQVIGFLTSARLSAPPEWQGEIAGFSENTFEARQVGAFRLPVDPIVPARGSEFAICRWWVERLPHQQRSRLTFVSINRLAELLLRLRPQILRALRATYPFVFVDEFQDTTYAQFSLLETAFGGGTAITAVGDDKQRIMTFAGARSDAFRRFERELGARRIALLFNFRSSPELVRIQHVVARAIEADTMESESRTEAKIDGDAAQVWVSSCAALEAQYIGRWIAEDRAARGLEPRDYCILVRQKADDYEKDLSGGFGEAGLGLRNESHALGRTTLQDLLSDDFGRIAIGLLRLSAAPRAPATWTFIASALEVIRAIDPDDESQCRKVDTELSAFIRDLRAELNLVGPAPEAAAEIAGRIIAFLDVNAVAASFPTYSTGDLLQIMAEAFGLHLSHSATEAQDWEQCVNAYDGVDKVPLMTVHKSKGLEYDTILFVGMDDQAWWSYSADNPEGLATFFVALSRAKQRAIFAFCKARGRRQRIADLYALLTNAGVPEIPIPTDTVLLERGLDF